MDIQEAKESIKEFVDTRLKSPFFVSAFAIWIFTYRTLIFGMFNFTTEMSFTDRVSWAKAQMNLPRKVFPFFEIKFSGFTESIVYSLGYAFIIMIGYNLLNTLSKIVYLKTDSISKSVLQKINPSNYIERREYIRLQKRAAKIQGDLSEIETKFSDLKETTEKLSNKEVLLNDELSKLNTEVQKLKTIESENDNEKNKFTLLYARYGKYNKYIEVTKTLSDNLKSRTEIEVTNELFNFDPYPFKIKDLIITYKYKGKEFEITAQENEVLKFIDNNIQIEKTENSITKQVWLGNQIQLLHTFSGRWEYHKITDGTPSEKEEFRIDEFANYLVSDTIKYNVQVPVFELPKKMIIRKINIFGEIQEEERIEKINVNLFRGYNLKNEIVEYRKLDS